MGGHMPDLEPHKRKRDVDDHGRDACHHTQQVVALQQANTGHINYLTNSRKDRLSLIPGDGDTFADTLSLLSDYEGVLDRHESFASNLGAKLTGPRLLKGIDKFFDGPIKTNPPMTLSYQVSWLDIYTFAKAHPNEFTLTTLPDGSRCCQFICKGFQVEITEDDWRFISSGALNRIPLEHPLDEDEMAEMATLDILESRASILYQRADAVAARARILHHKLGLRKQDIGRRRQGQEGGSSGSRFQSVNQPLRTPQGSTYDLHQDLLQQFLSTPTSQSRSTSIAGLSQGSPSMATSQPNRMGGPARPVGSEDLAQDPLRPLITQKIDKLSRGDIIGPPCDRCRRLKLQCVKHLTACQGCTKKHAKCGWRSVTDEEVAILKRDLGVGTTRQTDADTEMERETGPLPPPSQSTPILPATTPSTSGPSTGHHAHQSHADMVLAPMTPGEGPRPLSRGGGGDISGPVAYGAHNILSGRYELPPMRVRTSLPHGSSQDLGANSTGTSLGRPSSTGQYAGERHSWVPPSNPQ